MDLLERALKVGKAVDMGDYIRFRRSVGDILEGSVKIKDGPLISGFPKIRRILVLKSGLEKHFPLGCFVEEKMNGYNVRVFWHDGLWVLTRRGIKCPYTLYRMEKKYDFEPFFKDFPNHMLIGEVVGLENPYQPHYYPEAPDFEFFLFDIRTLDGKPLPVEEKYKVAREYGIRTVRSFGFFKPEDGERLLKEVRALGETGREGIVLKKADMSFQAKYTANHSTADDLKFAFSLPFDVGKEFMFRRLVRYAFQVWELKGEIDEEARRLGNAILKPFVKSIEEGKIKWVGERFVLRAPKNVIEEFLAVMDKCGIKLKVLKWMDDGATVFRPYQRTTDKIRNYISGGVCEE